MRKVAVAVLVVIALLAAVAYVFLNLDAYIEQNREWLAARASEAVGRELQFEDVGVTLRGGLGASVSGLRVAEEEGFGDAPFLEVDSARVLVNPWAALRGSYEVTEVVLDRPRIRLVRTGRGLNAESLGERGGRAPGSETPPLPLLVSVLRIDDGSIRYVDRTSSPARELEIAAVDVSVAGFGSGKATRVDLAARVLATDRQDLQVTGTVGPVDLAAPATAALDLDLEIGPSSIDEWKAAPVLAGAIPAALSSSDPIVLVAAIDGTVSAPRVAVAIDAEAAAVSYGEVFRKPRGASLSMRATLSEAEGRIEVGDGRVEVGEAVVKIAGHVRTGAATTFDLRVFGEEAPIAAWQELLPMLADYEVAGSVAPDLRLSGRGTPELAGSLALAGVELRRGDLQVTDLDAVVRLAGTRLALPRTDFRWNDAPTSIAAEIDRATESWSISGEVADLVLAPVLGELAPEAARLLEGRLDADLELRGRGTRWSTVRDSLTGNGRADLRDGVLRDVNIGEEVLSALTGVKGLTGLLSPQLRAAHPGLLETDDTRFEELGGRLRIAGGKVATESLVMAARDHRVEGSGWFSLVGAVDFRADLLASRALTDDLVGAVRELGALVGQDGRMRIPFEMRGTLPEARPQPDVAHVVGKLGRSAIESGLQRLLGRGDDESAEEGMPTPTPRAEQKLIERGLETLFGR